MISSSWIGAGGNGSLQVVCQDGGRVFCRGWQEGGDGNRNVVLAVLPATEHPTPASLDRLAHEFGLKDELDRAWAALPLGLVREHGCAPLSPAGLFCHRNSSLTIATLSSSN